MTALVTDYRRLVLLICRQFSEATGWVLRFTPATEETAEAVLDQLNTDACCCWHAEIRDELAIAGYLHLDVPQFNEPNSSLESVTALGQTLANLISELVSAAHQIDASSRDLSTLVDLKCAVREGTDLPRTMSDLLTAAAQLTESWGATFFLLNPTTNSLRLRAVYRQGVDTIPLKTRELRSDQPDFQALIHGPIVVQRDDPHGERLLPSDALSGLCVPVMAENVPLGTMWVYDRRQREFIDRQIHVLQSIAIQTAAILERMVLLRESEVQHRLSRELQVASENQPDDFVNHAIDDPMFEVAAFCISAHELGGDLCESIPLSSNRTGIAVGDASGNSIPAAMVKATARGALRTQQVEDPDVAGVMQRVNAALHTLTHSQHFMSLVYGVLDSEKRTFTYSNAGHCNPIFIRGDNVTTLESHGLLLGVLGDTEYGHSVVDLQPGDVLVIYSDGISEAMNRSRELFRSKGIIAAVRECREGTAAEILQNIWGRAEAHCDGDSLPDDRTLMVVKIRE
ncbi:Phosphoserine phosphatase RsbU [Symmachiella dynata]|nr:Phosphoserine phosphatase RsbU [Symmachiella dynata]